MDARKTLVYVARLSMEAERYQETVDAMKNVARMNSMLNPEEMNLISSAYQKVVGLRRASCRVLSSLEKCEEDELKLQLVKEYRAKIEAEVSDICSEIISIIDEHVIVTSSAGAHAAFYHKMKGDFCWFLADIRSGNERQQALDKSFRAYKSASTILDEVLYDHHPVRMGLAVNLSSIDLESLNTSQGAKYLEAMCQMPWEYTTLPPYIPAGVVSKILLHQTTKEIASSAVVSKLWNNLIFSQYFSELHFLSHGGEKGILHYSRADTVLRWIQMTKRDEIHREPTLTLSLLELNGASLLYSVRGVLFFKRRSEGILINPITNELLTLPSPQQPGFSVLYGFGYDAVNHKYKVLRMVSKRATLYTLGVRAWNDVPYPEDVLVETSMDGITVENCCHFFATIRKGGGVPRKVILAFNWETEKFCELPCGPGLTTRLNLNKAVLGVVKGRLAELYYGDGVGVSEFSVWCQVEYGKPTSWVEMGRVRQAISPHLHEFLMITLLDDDTLVLKMDDGSLVLLDSDGPLLLGGYRCTGLWDAVEYQPSFFKLELVNMNTGLRLKLKFQTFVVKLSQSLMNML